MKAAYCNNLNMLRQTIYIVAIVLSAFVLSFGQDPSPKSLNAVCSPIEDVGTGHPHTPPVAFGKAFVVPNMRLQFFDVATKKPMAGHYLVLHYTWMYFDPTHGEHCESGCWEYAYDNAQCVTDKDGMASVPEVNILPSGWFKTRPFFFHSMAPYFHDLEIDIHTEHWIIGYHISAKKLEKMKATHTVDVVYNVTP